MNTAAIILAAGKGTRMKSELPKVVHKLNGKPMIKYVVETAQEVGLAPIVAVVGHMKELVMAEAGDGVLFAIQEELRGTASAVMATKHLLSKFEGNVVILCGDSPLISKETIIELVEFHQSQGASGTILTAQMENPFAYGRIVRRGDNSVEKIVEEKDASEEEKLINEVNSSTYCFRARDLFEALGEVRDNNNQHELYLTDVIEIMKKKNQKIAALRARDWREIFGVNSAEQLAEAEEILKNRDIVS